VISFVAQAASSQVMLAPGKVEELKSSAVTGASETAKVIPFVTSYLLVMISPDKKDRRSGL
ncbi:hypothetical protein ACT4US_30215, partial [Bacillus sp. HC-Mk]